MQIVPVIGWFFHWFAIEKSFGNLCLEKIETMSANETLIVILILFLLKSLYFIIRSQKIFARSYFKKFSWISRHFEEEYNDFKAK